MYALCTCGDVTSCRCCVARALTGSFYTLPFVCDFIVDLLVGSPHPDVRHMALEQFWLLSQTQVSAAGVGDAGGGGVGVGLQTPQQFLLNAIHTARLPFWVSSSSTRGSSLRYFATPEYAADNSLQRHINCRLLVRTAYYVLGRAHYRQATNVSYSGTLFVDIKECISC